MVNGPNLKDIERELKNREHELEEFIKTAPAAVKDVEQALYRIREAIVHVNSAQKKVE